MGIFNFVKNMMAFNKKAKSVMVVGTPKPVGNISAELAAKIAADGKKERDNTFGVVVHHTDTDSLSVTRDILKARKLSTHFIIDKDGTIHYELPLDKIAAACVGLNRWMVQVDLVGRYEINKPNKKQVSALRDLLIELAGKSEIAKSKTKQEVDEYRHMDGKAFSTEMNRYFGELKHDRVDVFHVMMHGEVRPTRCPGKYLAPEIIKIRNKMYKFSKCN